MQEALVIQARRTFTEYETAGAVSGESFHIYEDTIDVIISRLDEFVAAEREEIYEIFDARLDPLVSLRNHLTLLGAAALVVALSLVLAKRRQSTPGADESIGPARAFDLFCR